MDTSRWELPPVLGGLEHGAALDAHGERSRSAAARLDAEAPDAVHRIATDGRTPREVALEILAVTGWASRDPAPRPDPPLDPSIGRVPLVPDHDD